MAGEIVPHNQMAYYRQRVIFWDRFFDSATDEQRKAQATKAIGELDALWKRRGLMGEDFFVSGEGMWTETVSEQELDDEVPEEHLLTRFPRSGHITVARFGKIQAMRGFSQGFSVMEYTDEPHAILSYQFRRDNAFGGNNAYFEAHIGHHLQVKLGTLSLIQVSEAQLKLQKLDFRFSPLAAHN